MPNVLDGPKSCLAVDSQGHKLLLLELLQSQKFFDSKLRFLNFKFLPLISAFKKPKANLLIGANESARQAGSNDTDLS